MQHFPPVVKILKFIYKAQRSSKKCKYDSKSISDIEGQCILIPDTRTDGVGIQAMVRICIMFLAQQANAMYVHVPFLKLAHQNIDPVGQSMSTEDWALRWEYFLNLGEDEFQFAALAKKVGKIALAKQFLDHNSYFEGPSDDLRHKLPYIVEQIRDRNLEAQRIWRLNLGICRQPRECKLFLDEGFIQALQQKFRNNGYVPEEILYEDQNLNIAIHIRRGDVWDACQAGSTKGMYTNKLVTQEYYVELLQKLQHIFRSSLKPVHFHIFSDGRHDDFDSFTFKNEHEAYIELQSGRLIKNIKFHLRQSTISTLYHMTKAPIFIPGKSTFSVLAVILGDSHILYDDQITEFYQYLLIEQYMKGNTRFTPLKELQEHDINNIVQNINAEGS